MTDFNFTAALLVLGGVVAAVGYISLAFKLGFMVDDWACSTTRFRGFSVGLYMMVVMGMIIGLPAALLIGFSL